MDVDKIFIINLASRQDRKEHMINEMNRLEIHNFEFFKAIKPTIKEIIQWNNHYCNHVKHSFVHNRFLNYQIGCLGCLKSHLAVCELALERNYKKILILEDDTEFIYSLEELSRCSKQINNDYDMLYLCGSHLGKKERVTENIIKVNGTHTTGSYIITEKAMKYLIENIESYAKEIDVFYGTILQTNFNCYCTIPHITRQKSGYSDIQQGYVNYKTAQ